MKTGTATGKMRQMLGLGGSQEEEEPETVLPKQCDLEPAWMIRKRRQEDRSRKLQVDGDLEAAGGVSRV